MIADGTIATIDVAADAITSAKILNGTITGADLAASAVGSTEILDGSIAAVDLAAGAVLEPGVEFVAGAVNIDPAIAASTAASLSVSHPGTGYIVAHAIGQIQCSAAQNITLGITNNTSSTDGWVYGVPTGVANYTMVHKQEVIPVTGAGTATINFNVATSSVDNCTYFRAINFDAVYVPVRY
jgi:hypothetical protein